MNFDDLADEVFEHPNAKAIVERVQTELEKEQRAREEFREWLDDNVKAEFINGGIVMHSPVKRGLIKATLNLSELLDIYVKLNKLGEISSEKALIGLTRNDYEPDIAFWSKEKAKDFNAETMVHPAPDLIVEVLSKETKSIDKGVKFDDYAAHRIAEYWMVNYQNQTVQQYILAEEGDTKYTLLKDLKIGQIIESQVIVGFKIPIKAIFDEEANIKALRELFKI